MQVILIDQLWLARTVRSILANDDLALVMNVFVTWLIYNKAIYLGIKP